MARGRAYEGNASVLPRDFITALRLSHSSRQGLRSVVPPALSRLFISASVRTISLSPVPFS